MVAAGGRLKFSSGHGFFRSPYVRVRVAVGVLVLVGVGDGVLVLVGVGDGVLVCVVDLVCVLLNDIDGVFEGVILGVAVFVGVPLLEGVFVGLLLDVLD